MIPKVIHYCWFGEGEKPSLAKKCISSWEKYCPDYKIIEWNEKNFNINKYPYARYCLENRKWAFLSDFVRLVVVYENGGVYFDTDVELISSIDHLLKYTAFYGFETKDKIATGLGFGAERYHVSVQRMMNEYLNMIPNENGEFPIIVCPELNTRALIPLGVETNGTLQIIDNMIILTSDYLNPYDDPTGVLKKTNNTISIHWYGKSWMKKSSIIRSTLTKPFHRIFGVDCFRRFKK